MPSTSDFPFRQAVGRSLRVGAIEAVAVLIDGDLGDDWDPGPTSRAARMA